MSTWGSPQERYTRGCMLLLFHKSLYEHYNEPCITDAEFDQLERHVEELEAHLDVIKHPEAPTYKRPCPAECDLPRTVQRWIEIYQRDNRPPAMPREFECRSGNEKPKPALKPARRRSSKLKPARRRTR